ncbi:MAG TPA: HD domain-containing phosphohydrolase [Dehalococcoidia bacterium]|nr:HD domain-containing phosphohydrolase [Dehalococcoidia bacterium]
MLTVAEYTVGGKGCRMDGERSTEARLRCADLLAALSLVTDLGMGNPPEAAMRGCLLATALARRVGLDERTAADVYYTTLLRYVGCTAPAHEQAFLAGGDDISLRSGGARLDWGEPREALSFVFSHAGRGQPPLRRARQLAIALAHPAAQRQVKTADCEVASTMARRLGLSAAVQRGLHEVFERWDGRGAPQGLRGEAIALPARFAQVATHAVLLERLGGRDATLAALRRRAGGQLDPALTAAFVRHGPELLEEIAAGDVWQAVLAAEPSPQDTIPHDGLDEVARAFGDVVDLKTPYTPGHAAGVAELAEGAARGLKLGAAEAVVLRRAALLHDLGRAGVPNSAWERRGPLTTADWERVRLHAYHSERILARSPLLAPLASIAGMHHERQDGSGYHRQARSAAIPLAARILAAADVFQALTQDRPHRPALPAETAAARLIAEARAGRLDGDAVDVVLSAAGHRSLRPRRARPHGLTDREVEVLRLVARGCSTRAIAQQLVISPKTADHHVQNVYAKIGVSTRASATMFALEHDLLRA